MRKIMPISTILLFVMTSLSYQKHKSNFNLELGKGIELEADSAYPGENISTFNYLKIIQNGKVIFNDTTLAEYSFDDTLYPKLYDFRSHLEILIEIDKRPSKNAIYKFSLQNNEVVDIDTLPTFISFPKDLDGDKKLEYAGIWDYGEVWGDSIEVTGYNPIIYYEIAKNGIELDSKTTIKKNKEIYGEFYGYKYNENIEIPYKPNDKLSEEIDKIEIN